jgi:pSer/pThr/pTyr-binding forkhead associated (FHA) protein
MPTLRVKLPDQAEAVYALTGERVTVGRRPDNTIQILDRSVSAHHAEFQFVDGHYRLHDLQSTNLTSVDGAQIADFHLHNACKVTFGNVECHFDPAPNVSVLTEEVRLTPAQMEKDMAFLRAENQEHLNKIDSLQRRIDILSSARLVTSKMDALSGSTPEEVKRLITERDELRFQNSGLKLELEKLRQEITSIVQERDQARQAYELLQAERSSLQDELKNMDKGTTQRIVFPAVATK